MTSITSEYLIGIIERCISTTINQRRNTSDAYRTPETLIVTDEEILDFIVSIPYFDIKLKDFIIGNLSMQAIIISQTWENEFIKKCIAWATSNKWLEGNISYLNNNDTEENRNFLSLPY